jgi:hypothetical protein
VSGIGSSTLCSLNIFTTFNIGPSSHGKVICLEPLAHLASMSCQQWSMLEQRMLELFFQNLCRVRKRKPRAELITTTEL